MSPGSDERTTIGTQSVLGRTRGSVLVVLGESSFSTHRLPERGAWVLGRDKACDLVLEHPKISRRHARLEFGAGVRVEDLGSTNGVRIAGRRVGRDGPVALGPGDSIHIAPFTLLLLDADEAAGSTVNTLLVPDPTARGAGRIVERLARAGVSVLIHGETGVGKEVLARTLHELSGRAGALVSINCAALSETLLESELFGHERGAFTGALATKPGLLETAAGGTVFLDEIGDLPASLQARLLRVLETREVFRVGGVKPTPLDVRFVAATNQDLAAATARGAFRKDLFFRVNGIGLHIPPLRERRDAIPVLARQFLEAGGEAGGRPHLGAAARARLMAHDWPGNVRELKAVIERALVLCDGAEILPEHVLIDAPRAAATERPDPERLRFLSAVRLHAGNVSAIARLLATSRSHVRRLATRYGVDLERQRGARADGGRARPRGV